MAILIKAPLNLGTQTFRMNRSNRDGTPKPGWWEAADCRKFGCDQYLLGWTTTLDPSTEQGQGLIRLIRSLTNRTFREEKCNDGMFLFHFEPGQKCFRQHQMPVERDPIFSNLARGRETKGMDYDEFHDTWNETVTRIEQSKREV